MVSRGALRFGQCPVAAIRTSTEPGIRSCTNSPTAVGAITSSLHCNTSVGTVTKAQVLEVAKQKMKDLNTDNLEAAVKTIAGSARSMGLQVVE